MPPASSLTFPELKQALTPQYVLTLALIHVALAIGVILFGAVALFLFLRSDPTAPPTGLETVRLLSLVNLGLACCAYAVAPVLFGAALRRTAKTAKTATGGLGGVQAAYIVRAALLEGPAFVGLVTFFLMNRSLLSEHPIYALNLATPVLFVLFIVATFPTRDRLEDLLRERF